MVSGIAHHGSIVLSGVVAASLVGRAVTGAPASALRPGIIGLLLLVLPLVVAPWLETQIAHTMAFRVLVDVRDRVYAAFERLAPAGLLRRRTGDVGAAAMADVELLEVFFAPTLSQLVSAAVVPVGATIAAAFFHPLLAVVLVPVLLASAIVPARLRRGSLRSGVQLRERLGTLSASALQHVDADRVEAHRSEPAVIWRRWWRVARPGPVPRDARQRRPDRRGQSTRSTCVRSLVKGEPSSATGRRVGTREPLSSTRTE